jgi:hypothetical protein
MLLMNSSWLGRILLVACLSFAQSASAYYNPTVGRWLNRDLIGEQDGPGIQVFARNTPTSVVDADGLANRNAPPARITNPGEVTYPGWSETAPWDPARIRNDRNRVPFTAALGVAGSACSVVIGGALVLSPEPTALTKAAGAYMVGAGLDGLYSSFTGGPGLREQGLQSAGIPPGFAITAILVSDMTVCGKCCPGGNAYPRGFASADQFGQAVTDLKNALASGGIQDATVGVRGSSVTGFNYRTGAPFGPRSDIDFFIESGDLTQGLKTSRNIPGFVYPNDILKRCEPIADWSKTWSRTLNRKVSVGGFQPGTGPITTPPKP